MNVEKLGITEIAHRVWIAEGWGNDEPSLSEGHLVTAAVRETARVARAREDALLEALKIMVRDANKSSFIVRMNSYKKAQDTIRQIEESR